MRGRWALLGLGALALVSTYGVLVAQRAVLQAPTPTPFLTDRHGQFLAQLGHEREVEGARHTEYGFWAAAPPPDRVVRATLALEDRRFWSHPGVDPLSVLRAAWQNLRGLEVRSGASTVAMQVARMQAPAARHLWSKALEAGTAVALTLRYGREAVLEQYLRLVPYGNGSHGIAHAARFYLDKPATDLSWAEIAFLSAIPQAPALHNPLRPEGLRRAIARGQRALTALAAQGTIPADELDTARAQLAALVLAQPPRRPAALHLIARLRATLARDGAATLDAGDPRLRTRLDLGVQSMVEELAQAQLEALRPRGAQQVAAMVVRRADRQVIAAMGSAGFATTPGGAFDYASASRSPGSTLKPFLYALALQRGGPRAGRDHGRPAGRRLGHRQCGWRLARPDPCRARHWRIPATCRRPTCCGGWGSMPASACCSAWACMTAPDSRSASASPWRSAACPRVWSG